VNDAEHDVAAITSCLLASGWAIDWSFSGWETPSDSLLIWRDLAISIYTVPIAKSHEPIFWLQLFDTVTVKVLCEERLIVVRADRPDVTADSLRHFVLDQVVPRVIAHVGATVLHAALVSADGEGIAICGPSGRGKSTLAAGLRKFGYRLHGDDTVVIRTGLGSFLASSVYPSLRLLPDALAHLVPTCPDVRAVAENSAKGRVPVRPGGSEPLAPVPLFKILVLAPPPADDRITLRPMRPAEACMAFIENSFALDPTDRERARDKLVMASDLAAAVAAFELSYPRDYGRLDDLRRTLVNAGILPPLDVGTPCPEWSV
jgi:hypothetical protein